MKKTDASFRIILRVLSFVVFFSLTYISASSYAQYLTGPVASGLGGAGRAAVDEGELILLNPAAVVHATAFSSAIFYEDGYLDKNTHDRATGVNLVDNSEGLFISGGYTYINRRRTFDQIATREENYHQVSLGKFVAKHFSVGAAITYLDSNIIGGRSFDQLDYSLAVHYNPDPDTGFGLVVYNLAAHNKNIQAEILNRNVISLGVHYMYMPQFRFRFDLSKQTEENPDKKFRYQMGLESHVSKFLTTRIGYDSNNLADRRAYTLGLCFDGPRLKADYFYSKNIDYNGGAMHGVDLRLPFW
ncbi:MAG: hypothetical protein A2Z20_07630 [Bdellovibrionales bacterium RBG_16_40_8]|nr:MAG: hypothetical protein A2Z20_07630 [Bdellovibrionales bacterium RBG_16_40_8]